MNNIAVARCHLSSTRHFSRGRREISGTASGAGPPAATTIAGGVSVSLLSNDKIYAHAHCETGGQLLAHYCSQMIRFSARATRFVSVSSTILNIQIFCRKNGKVFSEVEEAKKQEQCRDRGNCQSEAIFVSSSPSQLQSPPVTSNVGTQSEPLPVSFHLDGLLNSR